MCGIVGIIARKGAPVSPEALDRATDLVAHRGPDGRGTLIDGAVGLGHRRLAILDLTDDGRQPMRSADDTLTLVFNGEIYNYLELREELKTLGHAFRTRSDSEVILAAYRQWGPECVTRFNGMWAFAIHDRLKAEVFLSRDRFGVKPLFYVETPEVFVFGSEIGQLLPHLPARRTRLDRARCFLLTGGLDLDQETFFEGIHKLPPGSNALYSLDSQRLAVAPYFALRHNGDYASLPTQEAVRLFAATLEDAVRLRLRSDVLVGTCLSGGLDSSSIATLASAASGSAARFNAITAISEDPSTDETPFAEKVVANSGLNWIRVRPTYEDFVDSLPAIVASQQEPFGGPSLTMQHFVMKAARDNGIKVLLDGQAGDETLLGYDKYYYAYLRQLWREAGWKGVADGLQSIRKANGRLSPAGIAKYVLGARLSSVRAMVHRREMPFLAGSDKAVTAHLSAFAAASGKPFDLQRLEIESTNLPVLLRYEDRNSMAHAVEARLPFLDYRLVELALSLPIGLKIRDGWTKWILRKAMDGRMPPDVVWRRNKYSFNAPDNIWLRRHAGDMKREVLASSLVAAVTRREGLQAGFDGLSLNGQWRLYSLALWQKAFGVSA